MLSFENKGRSEKENLWLFYLIRHTEWNEIYDPSQLEGKTHTQCLSKMTGWARQTHFFSLLDSFKVFRCVLMSQCPAGAGCTIHDCGLKWKSLAGPEIVCIQITHGTPCKSKAGVLFIPESQLERGWRKFYVAQMRYAPVWCSSLGIAGEATPALLSECQI